MDSGSLADWASAGATIVAGFSAVATVMVALRNYKRHEQEKLLDQIKVDVIDIKAIYEELDGIISFPLFLEIAEIFGKKIVILSESRGDIDKFINFVCDDRANVSLHRALTRSAAESDSVSRSSQLIADARKSLVRLGQNFPVSSSVLSTCIKLIDMVVRTSTNSLSFEDILSREAIEEFTVQHKGQSINYSHFAEKFASLASDAPMNTLKDRGQGIIDNCHVILNVVCNMLTRKNYEQLRSLRDRELNDFKKIIETDTFTGDIDVYMRILRPYISEAEWDSVLESNTKLKALFNDPNR